jgi:hypothetical protein
MGRDLLNYWHWKCLIPFLMLQCPVSLAVVTQKWDVAVAVVAATEHQLASRLQQ